MMSSLLKRLGESKQDKNIVCLAHNIPSYKHAVDGMVRVAREEGFRTLFSGANWATGRAVSN